MFREKPQKIVRWFINGQLACFDVIVFQHVVHEFYPVATALSRVGNIKIQKTEHRRLGRRSFLIVNVQLFPAHFYQTDHDEVSVRSALGHEIQRVIRTLEFLGRRDRRLQLLGGARGLS